MKTMKNFAAQQLTKKQMNEVKGGKHHCSVYTASGVFINEFDINGASSSYEAADIAASICKEGYYFVCGHVVE